MAASPLLVDPHQIGKQRFPEFFLIGIKKLHVATYLEKTEIDLTDPMERFFAPILINPCTQTRFAIHP
jgi:hypothetical protein